MHRSIEINFTLLILKNELDIIKITYGSYLIILLLNYDKNDFILLKILGSYLMCFISGQIIWWAPAGIIMSGNDWQKYSWGE